MPSYSRELVLAREHLARYGASMLAHCIYVPDSSALLRLYESSPDERERYLSAFLHVQERIWVAHRTRKEVIRRLRAVKSRNRRVIPHIGNFIDKVVQGLQRTISGRKDINSSYDVVAVALEVVQEARLSDTIRTALLAEERAAFHGADSLLGKILMDNFVGQPLDPDRLDAVLRTGINRLSQSVPPGFEDLKKIRTRSAEDAMGDLVFWEEALYFASHRRRNLVIVTAEEKDDWWVRGPASLEPHPALINEMNERCGQRFGCMTLEDFASTVRCYDEALVIAEIEESQRWAVANPALGFSGALKGVALDLISAGYPHGYQDVLKSLGLDRSNAFMGLGLESLSARYPDVLKSLGLDRSSGVALRHLLRNRNDIGDLNSRNEKRRARRRAARAAGICTACFREPVQNQASPTFLTCTDCRRKRRDRRTARHEG